MADPVFSTHQLDGQRWPTVDPFLMCVHHVDYYPAGDGSLAPAASLVGRELGSDFVGIDGWRMYHGRHVPGFPVHPHRGFETVTYVRSGLVDHADSLGATARYGSGDVQWLTAGSGIQHAEMFPLVATDGPNTLELFQIWVNLPAAKKFAAPSFTMFAGHALPQVVEQRDDAPDGPTATITVIAGNLADATALAPPPDSWASDPRAELVIWHATLEPDAQWTIPPAANPDALRTMYIFDDGELAIAGHDGTLKAGTAASIDAHHSVTVSSPTGTQILILGGVPIAEPVASYGPFVMNTEEEIHQAFADYRTTQFGGWPWPNDDPVHPADQQRFAHHSDGTFEDLVEKST